MWIISTNVCLVNLSVELDLSQERERERDCCVVNTWINVGQHEESGQSKQRRRTVTMAYVDEKLV